MTGASIPFWIACSIKVITVICVSFVEERQRVLSTIPRCPIYDSLLSHRLPLLSRFTDIIFDRWTPHFPCHLGIADNRSCSLWHYSISRCFLRIPDNAGDQPGDQLRIILLTWPSPNSTYIAGFSKMHFFSSMLQAEYFSVKQEFREADISIWVGIERPKNAFCVA